MTNMTSIPSIPSNNNSNKNTNTRPRMNQLKMPFPWKLHHMLAESETSKEQHNIISWLPDGKAFFISDEPAFVEQIMPRYFNQSKFKSFSRQLYIYGFLKIPPHLPNEGAFYHAEFLRDDPQSCFALRRNLAGGDRRRRGSGTSNGSGASSSIASSNSGRDSVDSNCGSRGGGSGGMWMAAPPTIHSNNNNSNKAQRRSSLSDYVSGRPLSCTNSTTNSNFKTGGGRRRRRRCSMGALPASSMLPLVHESSMSSYRLTSVPSLQQQQQQQPANTAERRNSLSEFFDQALTLLPSGDTYAALPCCVMLPDHNTPIPPLLESMTPGTTTGTIGNNATGPELFYQDHHRLHQQPLRQPYAYYLNAASAAAAAAAAAAGERTIGAGGDDCSGDRLQLQQQPYAVYMNAAAAAAAAAAPGERTVGGGGDDCSNGGGGWAAITGSTNSNTATPHFANRTSPPQPPLSQQQQQDYYPPLPEIQMSRMIDRPEDDPEGYEDDVDNEDDDDPLDLLCAALDDDDINDDDLESSSNLFYYHPQQQPQDPMMHPQLDF